MRGGTQVSFVTGSVSGVGIKLNQFAVEMGLSGLVSAPGKRKSG